MSNQGTGDLFCAVVCWIVGGALAAAEVTIGLVYADDATCPDLYGVTFKAWLLIAGFASLAMLGLLGIISATLASRSTRNGCVLWSRCVIYPYIVFAIIWTSIGASMILSAECRHLKPYALSVMMHISVFWGCCCGNFRAMCCRLPKQREELKPLVIS